MENFYKDACWPPNDQVCPHVCSCVSELTHVCQLIIAIYCNINNIFMAFGYSSCIEPNEVMLISSQYKQFKAANPNWKSANKKDLSLLFLFMGYEEKNQILCWFFFCFTGALHTLPDLYGYPPVFLLSPFYLQYIFIMWQCPFLKPVWLL